MELTEHLPAWLAITTQEPGLLQPLIAFGQLANLSHDSSKPHI